MHVRFIKEVYLDVAVRQVFCLWQGRALSGQHTQSNDLFFYLLMYQNTYSSEIVSWGMVALCGLYLLKRLKVCGTMISLFQIRPRTETNNLNPEFCVCGQLLLN